MKRERPRLDPDARTPRQRARLAALVAELGRDRAYQLEREAERMRHPI